MSKEKKILKEVTGKKYKYGFTTKIKSENIRKGLDEDVIRLISKKKKEPDWLLESRLKSFKIWKKLKEPSWANLKLNPIKYQDIIYYSAPVQKKKPKSLKDVDPEILKTFNC